MSPALITIKRKGKHLNSGNLSALMEQLDSAYQREQLMLEVLLDIRDAMLAIGQAETSKSALEKLDVLRKLTKLR